jgi:hypothetical protein
MDGCPLGTSVESAVSLLRMSRDIEGAQECQTAREGWQPWFLKIFPSLADNLIALQIFEVTNP